LALSVGAGAGTVLAAAGGEVCATIPAPLAGAPWLLEASLTACQRLDRLSAWSALGFGVLSVGCVGWAFCACSSPVKPKVTEPRRLERPTLDGLMDARDARLDALRSDFRLIRRLPSG
jgi:hypothetical protein